MTVEARPINLSENLHDLGFSSRTLNPEIAHNFSKETTINAGSKIAGATILTVGLYKMVAAENLTDIVIGGVLMYAGYNIFTHKSKKAA